MVHGGKIYVSGGFSATHRGKCGSFDCKDGVDPSGSLRTYMDDVWARYSKTNPFMNQTVTNFFKIILFPRIFSFD